MIQSHHNHEGIDFIVIRDSNGIYQATHYEGLCGFGRSAPDACQDAWSVESAFSIYPVIDHLEVTLCKAFDNCNDTAKQATLGKIAFAAVDWMRDYDNGLPVATYLSGFNIISDALDAFADCGYEINTGDVWT